MLPGDKKYNDLIADIIRVNHAGEYGAKRIYNGQEDFTKDKTILELIKHMATQEHQHLEYFENQITSRKIRPTLLMPLWHIYGYAIGAATAILGTKMAMTCTQAVEEVIDKHYTEQLKLIENSEPDLANHIEQFRQEELEHRDIAIENRSAEAVFHSIVSKAIKLSCKAAIRLSKIF
jgi:ubiquinone biosynthesis monooxygenase Coq7